MRSILATEVPPNFMTIRVFWLEPGLDCAPNCTIDRSLIKPSGRPTPYPAHGNGPMAAILGCLDRNPALKIKGNWIVLPAVRIHTHSMPQRQAFTRLAG
jgi:hypothetical protein